MIALLHLPTMMFSTSSQKSHKQYYRKVDLIKTAVTEKRRGICLLFFLG